MFQEFRLNKAKKISFESLLKREVLFEAARQYRKLGRALNQIKLSQSLIYTVDGMQRNEGSFENLNGLLVQCQESFSSIVSTTLLCSLSQKSTSCEQTRIDTKTFFRNINYNNNNNHSYNGCRRRKNYLFPVLSGKHFVYFSSQLFLPSFRSNWIERMTYSRHSVKVEYIGHPVLVL